ncbi:MAG: type II toxin-antitoxin system VapC family toxin [Solirubrobacteraceae bacterium]
MTTLVDSSVLLDVIAPSDWREWSAARLAEAADGGEVGINQVIYAEIAAGFATRERLERVLGGVGVKRLNLPFSAAWRVANAFSQYRRAGGPRTIPLPDFFIGAHAAAAGLPLLTRDPARVRTYFPEVDLLAPEEST